MNLDEMIGSRVTLHGTAADAHAGAVLLLDDGTPVYIDGMPAWDDGMSGQEIALTGVLGREQLGPEPAVDDHGGHRHGMSGTPYTLRDVTR